MHAKPNPDHVYGGTIGSVESWKHGDLIEVSYQQMETMPKEWFVKWQMVEKQIDKMSFLSTRCTTSTRRPCKSASSRCRRSHDIDPAGRVGAPSLRQGDRGSGLPSR